jgi:signal transduction histidine kinase
VFSGISRRLALQFTGFVFLLLLCNGLVFLVADAERGRRQAQGRIAEVMRLVTERVSLTQPESVYRLPPPLRERVRLVAGEEIIVYEGGFFDGLVFRPEPSIESVIIEGDPFDVLTTRLWNGSDVLGYVQVAEPKRLPGEVAFRALLYVFVSLIISAFTYLVGLTFARQSLQPARQMLERLEQFTQDASHELRTPLTTLQTTLDLALRTGEHEQGLRSAQDDVRTMTGIVSRLLDLARLDRLTLQPEPFDVAPVVHEVIASLQAQIDQAHVSLRTTIDPTVRLRGDAGLFRQLVSNLVSNAIKFHQPGRQSEVGVTLSSRTLRVSDNGVGMTPDALTHVFDRFYQVNESRSEGGYGLGLALVKRIVDLHGWKIEVQSEVGQGSSFMVVFQA